MELKEYFALIRRWAWLFGLGLVLGAAAGVILSFFQTPIYEASTRVLVMRAPQEKATDYTYLSDQQLVQTYIQLLSTRPVIDGASVKMGLIIDPNQISVQQIRDTQAIQVTVKDISAQRASNIANILIQVLIEQNEVIQAGRYTSTEQSTLAQIQQIEAQIAQLEVQNNVFTEGSQEEQQMEVYQQIYISLLNNLEEIRLARLQNTPNVVQIESAIVPEAPIRPRPLLNTILGGVMGLMMAGGIIFLVDYIDDTIRSPEDIDNILKLPVVGYVGDMNGGRNGSHDLHVFHNPRSPISESFRSLRTNLEFANVDSLLKKILITSPGSGEGKTTVATNLAVIIAQGGKRVLLIDADLRRPRIHSIFGISNRVGLTTLFRGQMHLNSAMHHMVDAGELYVMASGGLPPNPTELLASFRMDQILQEASQSFDVIILDSPPSLVADFQVLSTKVDGTFLVIQPGVTHADMALATLGQLNRVNARIIGVVLNKISKNGHYGSYKHGGYYYNLPEGDQQSLPDNQMNLLPGNQSDNGYMQSGQSLGQLDSIEGPQVYANPYVPSQEVPATRNVITEPKQDQDITQGTTIEVVNDQSSSEFDFHTWYLDQDDEPDIDEW